MKKLLTIALAIICIVVLTGLAVGHGAQQKDKQKNPPTSRETKPPPPKPPTTIDSTKGNTFRLTTKVMKGTVTKVDDKAKNFTVKGDDGKESIFLGTELKALPKEGERVEVTYIQPTLGGALEARHFSRVLMQQGRAMDKDDAPKVMIGEVAEVNEKNKTFKVKPANGKEEVTFSAEKMKGDFSRSTFKVGDIIEVTYGASDARTPRYWIVLEAVTVRVKLDRFAPLGRVEKVISGTVTQVDEKAETFTVTGDGKERTFQRATALKTAELKRDLSVLPTITELKALLKSGELVQVTYTETPGALPTATTVKGSKSNSDNVSKAKDKPKAGETTLKKPR